MRTWLAALLGLTLLGGIGCAPVSTKTHFDRWAEETEKMKAEEAAEEAAQAKSEGKTAPAKKKATKKVDAPPPDYSSLPSGETPDITKTSTPSRVVAPDDDEDVIY